MSTHDYKDDYELVWDLGKRLGLKRMKDVLPDTDYVLHASYWWRVLGEVGDTGSLELEIAAPADPIHPESSILVGDEDSLEVTAPASSGFQFQNGTLLDVLWPCCGLIYVRNARRRGIGDDPDEKVFGIFALRYDSDGGSYYAPVDQERQPGVSSAWYLFPGRDLILDWEPVDVAELLREYSRGRHD